MASLRLLSRHGGCGRAAVSGLDGLLHPLNLTRGGVVKRPGEGTCRGCHTPERSPAFDAAARLERIAHSEPPT